MEREEQIRCLAYNIWEKEGYPHGHHIEHWLKAETIWHSQFREENNEKKKEKKPSRREPARKRTTHQPPAGLSGS
jgi:hypothetical protein